MSNISLHRDVALQAYREAGGWSRHYSSIRAAVPTFLYGIAIAILQQTWESPSWSYFWGTAVAATGAVVFMTLFTLLANRDREYQKSMFDKLADPAMGAPENANTVQAYPKRSVSIWDFNYINDSAWYLSFALTLVLSGFIYTYWHNIQ